MRLTRWGLTIAAGFACLLPVATARAQYSMGYDSLTYGPTAQTYWYDSGYQSIYTEPATGSFVNGSVVPNQTTVPYLRPPYGAFPRGNDLPAGPPRPILTLRPSAVVPESTESAHQQVIRQRRGLIRRRR